VSRNETKSTQLLAQRRTRLFFLVLMGILIIQGGMVLPTAQATEYIADLEPRINERQNELDQLKAELEQLDALIISRDADLEANRHQMADANANLRLAEERYNETLAVYEERLIALYKNGEHKFYSLIITSEGFNDALTRVSYVSKISDNDIKLIRRVEAEKEELREAQEEVDALKQVTAASLDTMLDDKLFLEVRIDELQGLQDKEKVELVKARAIEAEAAAMRLAEEAARIDLSGMGGDSFVVQGLPPAGLEPTGTVLHGVASWYGPGFHGNRTANGETYDMYSFTAAHKTLPFNTWLKVSYNGRSVFVRINDRGPYIGGRFLDLSKSGAQALGFSGVAYITAEIYS
jgi:rare lipoprotein A (peptidoglycan hydrolase)